MTLLIAALTSGMLLFSFVTLATEISNLPSKLPVQPAGAAPVGVSLSVTPCGMAITTPKSAEARAKVSFILDTAVVEARDCSNGACNEQWSKRVGEEVSI